MLASYNAPAGFNVNNSWDIYATASFIYWQARQENMEIGIISRNDPEALSSITTLDINAFLTPYVNNMAVTSPNFTYRPGFKVGLGGHLNWNDLDAYAEYTWFHGSIGSGVRPLPRSTATGAAIPNGEYLYPMQLYPHTEFVRVFCQNADQSWSLRMDFLDLSLSRSYYSGTKLTIRPFFGARGAWIRQNLTTTYNGSSNYAVSPGNGGYRHLKVSNYSASWGVGPRAGFESNWLLGYGCRLIGNGSADILYTRYDTHFTEIMYQFAGTLPANPILNNFSVSQVIDLLRTHLDFEMGFGWGSYSFCNGYHIDLSATYGFQVFWNQNMMRNYYNVVQPALSHNPNGNLYVHGLTANAQFDF
jgi:hypothetical protein